MTNFDFENRTVASPYTVPDGFFDQMEERLALQAAAISREKPRPTAAWRYAAAAAVAALIVGTAALLRPSSARPTADYDEIAQMFQQLSSDDQNSMLESYRDDIFMNQ